jgi:hypothetical protein
MVRRHPVEFFIDCAHQNLPPEACDGYRTLFLLLEPGKHADAIEVGPGLKFGLGCKQSAADIEFVFDGKEVQPGEGLGEVKGSGQDPSFHHRKPAAGLNPEELFVKFDSALHAKTPVKIEQVGAATEKDVLAIVDGEAGPSAWLS